MTFAEALARLDARQPEHMPGPSLDRIRHLVTYLDHPERTYPTIHVTGTNGKSTAARVAASVACASGLTTGLYISPHLRQVTERFSVCGEDMSRAAFAEEWDHLQPYLELVDGLDAGEVTYFEALTALAFLWFADKPVALGVFEVGMGGSWDATNLIASDVAVVTPVALDHVAELGPTLTHIATEKAGIIKEGKVGVIRAQEPEVAVTLARRADEMRATLLHEGSDWELSEPLLAVGGQAFTLRTPHATYEDLFLPVFGAYAAANAGAGVVAFEALTGHALDDVALRDGLAAVRTPGRLEVVAHDPAVVLDGAHNPAGAAALATALDDLEPFLTPGRATLVTASMADKDVAGVVGALRGSPVIARARIIATTVEGPRAMAPGDLAAVWRGAGHGGPIDPARSPADALHDAFSAGSGPIVVAGSLYLVGAIRGRLVDEPLLRDPPPPDPDDNRR
jgi:dihydrofolate synthase / folylpolyglutamate synthase